MSLPALLFRLLFVTAVLGLGHYYLWRRLVRDTEPPRRWRWVLTGFIGASLLGLPATLALGRSFPREAIGTWAFAGFLWMGFLSTVFSLLVLRDLVGLTLRGLGKLRSRRAARSTDGVANPERRRTLRRLWAGAIAFAALGLGVEGVRTALGAFDKRRVAVTLSKLPRALQGFRIAQLSDVHVGPTIGRDFVELMVAETNALAPDLIAITGDLVDGSVESLREHVAPLARLRAPQGVYFVTGNHEYYSGAAAWIAELERLGIRVLRNERVTIGAGEDCFDLCGVNDYAAGRYDDPPDLAAALRGRPPEREVVLLAHQPRAVHEAQALDVGLVLSGHTHGGQFWPWSWVVHLAQPVVRGLAQFGRTLIYVSTGTGYWGPPMRTGTRPEITLLELGSGRRVA